MGLDLLMSFLEELDLRTQVYLEGKEGIGRESKGILMDLTKGNRIDRVNRELNSSNSRLNPIALILKTKPRIKLILILEEI
jgi:hypothetical protein